MKTRINESKLVDMLAESVVAELSSDLLRAATQKARDNMKIQGAKWPNDTDWERTDKRGTPWRKRARNFQQAAREAERRENNAGELEQEALRIWNENDLAHDIEWEDSDWVTSGDETYGPCGGFVECDGWEFEVPGEQEGPWDHSIDYEQPVEFTSPDGKSGYIYIN